MNPDGSAGKTVPKISGHNANQIVDSTSTLNLPIAALQTKKNYVEKGASLWKVIKYLQIVSTLATVLSTLLRVIHTSNLPRHLVQAINLARTLKIPGACSI